MGHGVLDELLFDFFHRQAFELVGPDSVTLHAQQRAAPQLLGPLGGDVDEQEPARDERRGLVGGGDGIGGSVGVVMVNHGA